MTWAHARSSMSMLVRDKHKPYTRVLRVVRRWDATPGLFLVAVDSRYHVGTASRLSRVGRASISPPAIFSASRNS